MKKTHDTKIAAMREGGRVLSATLRELLDFARPGVTLAAVEELAQQRIREAGMKPSFSTVGNYQWATCLCVNDVIVHGIPTSYALAGGDVLTIDVGLIHKTFHTDMAWSKVVHSRDFAVEGTVQKFLDVGQRVLQAAIGQARGCNRVGHISKAIQEGIEREGYGIVKALVGHGVGTTLHEPPQIPGFLRGAIEKTPQLTPCMTIAIEVIYTMGKPHMVYLEDGWSIATRDRSLSAVFEQTVAVTQDEPEIITPRP